MFSSLEQQTIYSQVLNVIGIMSVFKKLQEETTDLANRAVIYVHTPFWMK